MLLVGTSDHLEDLDRQYSLAEDVSVTAIAASWPPGARASFSRPAAHVLLDARRIARVEEYELSPVAELGEARGQSLAAAEGSLLVGMAGAHVAQVPLGDGASEGGAGAVAALPAFDAVDGRAGWENPAGPSPDLRSIGVTASGAWLVNVHVGGVWRSDDEGRSWTNAVPPDDDVHEVLAGAGGTVVAAAARGVGWSRDDGQTWEWSTDGLHAAYCRAVALADDAVFVSASTGPTTSDGRLYRAGLDAAGTPGPAAGPAMRFEQCRGGLPESFPYNLDTGSLAASGSEVAVGTCEGHVWRSRDSGATFERVTERVGHVRVVRFT